MNAGIVGGLALRALSVTAPPSADQNGMAVTGKPQRATRTSGQNGRKPDQGLDVVSNPAAPTNFILNNCTVSAVGGACSCCDRRNRLCRAYDSDAGLAALGAMALMPVAYSFAACCDLAVVSVGRVEDITEALWGNQGRRGAAEDS